MSNNFKADAARAALAYVRDGQKLGIGTGSTAEEFITLLAEAVRGGLDIVGVPTSERTREMCAREGIALTTLDETPDLDLTIDGADEIDRDLNLIKGGGGALLREKIVAAASAQMIVIADESKLVPHLGRFPLPVEVNIFGLAATRAAIARVAAGHGLQGSITLRGGAEKPFKTDGGHYILDASFGLISEPNALEAALNAIPGVVESGLFTGLATRAIVAGSSGIQEIERA